MKLPESVRHPVAALDNWWTREAPDWRLDHNPANLCMLIGLMLSSLSIILQGPTPNSQLDGMTDHLQIAMCCCIFGGLSIKLHGVFSHTRWWFPARPLKKCYQSGYTGAPLATSGMLVYGWYILSNTPTWLSALGSVLVVFLGVGVSLQAALYWLEARRIEHNEETLIHQYKQGVVEHERNRNS